MINKKQIEKINKTVCLELSKIFGYKPKKRIYLKDDNNAYYYCSKCKFHFDYKMSLKLGKLTHCNQSLIKKYNYCC